MKSASNKHAPLASAIRWLAEHAGFPRGRLPDQMERAILFIFAAEAEQTVGNSIATFIPGRDPAMTSSQKAHAMRRSLAHFKCDNSAKV